MDTLNTTEADLACPYTAELYCDEVIDYEALDRDMDLDVQLEYESSQQSLSDSSSQSHPEDMLECLVAEDVVMRRTQLQLQASLDQLQAQRHELQQQQLECMLREDRETWLARYGLLWSAEGRCPQCHLKLRDCTQCSYHQHMGTSGKVYWSLGPVSLQDCVLCLLDHHLYGTPSPVSPWSEFELE